MRSRVPLFVLLFAVGSFALPLAAHAGIPYFGPVIPQDGVNAVCPAGFGMLMVVINNIISIALTLAIVFVAPLMIGWAGFLYVVNPVDPSGLSKAKGILMNTVVGLVIALAGWMIVDAVMAVLYDSKTFGKTWSDLLTTNGAAFCLPQAGAISGVAPPPVPGIQVPAVPQVPGAFTFDPGISAQVPTESGALSALLSCMAGQVPAGVGRISSISDSLITSGSKTFAQCATGGCAHAANSCHYGGRTCTGSSYAVDFGDDQNISVLTAAAQACGANYIGNEGTHLHVSVGASCGCN